MEGKDLEKSYFEVLGLCCSSEVPMIEKILKPLEGVHHVSVVVPTRTVVVLHDVSLISQSQIVKVLNQARLEANVRMKGDHQTYRNKWPSPLAVVCGVLLLLSFLKYVYSPLKWLALGAVAVGIGPLILKAFASVRNLRIDINLLMLIAVGGSIFLKDYWEAGTIVFLLSISEWLNSRASHKATAVMSSLMSMAPQKAVLADSGEEVDTKEVMVNTRLAVKAGTMIPIDGVVVEGSCEVDEKALTGESFPVSKQVDSIVWAGTVNLNGYITVKTTALAEACVVAKMVKLVEEAQSNKSKAQRYVDKLSKYYTPAVCVVAACLAGIPAALRVHDVEKWYHLALVVLVAACPCALILSTPVAAFCALSKAATSGLLVKGAEYLETLSTVKFICFDKTGTITKGEFSISDFHPLIDNHNLLYWVSSLESKSSHPMAAALVDYARAHSVEPQPDNVEEFKDFPGEGIYGKIDGKDVYIGNRKIATRAGCSQVARNGSENNEGNSIGYIFVGSTPAGNFSLSDSCRIGVKEALQELKSMGIRTAMLTGDSQAAANYAQNQLGGALEVVHAELLPQDKAKIIREIQRESKTAMVGDGLNDAPALATADIGISMGVSGSALANETGHIILMSNDIRKIPVAVRLARKTRRKIFENIFISFITKAAIIALAIAGHPLVWAAVLADVGTCLLVILNSMLLLQGTTTSRRLKTHSGSSPKHAQYSSATRHGGCCGQEQGLQRLVQENKENDSCCASDEIPEWDETICDCCAEYANEVKREVQWEQGKDKHGCCTPDDDDEIQEVKHTVQPQQAAHKAKHAVQETKCCSAPKETKCCDTTKETKCVDAPKETKCCDAPKETKCSSVPKETKCCDAPKETRCCDATTETKCSKVTKETKCCDITRENKCSSVPKETKCCDTTKDTKCSGVTKETKCCDTTKEAKCPSNVPKETKCCDTTKDTKCSSVTKETKCCDTTKETKCCSVPKETRCCDITRETKCSSVPKDLESQSSVDLLNQDKAHFVNMEKDDDPIKEYATGKVMKDCCRRQGLKKRNVNGCCNSFTSYKCCGVQYFGGRLNRKGYLSEIVIQ